MKYKYDSSVIPTVRAHFPRKCKSRSLTYAGCANPSTAPDNTSDPIDTSEHILLVCEAYRDLKDEAFDPENDEMLAEFLRNVVKRRMEKGHD